MGSSRRRRRVLVAIAAALAVVIVGVNVWARTASRPPLGLVEGRLRPCPDRPNCVCSQAADPSKRMEPLTVVSVDAARERLEQVLAAMPRTRIVTAEPRYLAVECRSLLLGFVDDVEFHVDESSGLLHFRSASRLGYSDLGVNRRRLERIVAALADDPAFASASPPSAEPAP
ncbi:MAG: DUF1499 domain-containing protein [Planctomycetota bacterium]|jgi:uncharacterized protein (DUF1499 family)